MVDYIPNTFSFRINAIKLLVALVFFIAVCFTATGPLAYGIILTLLLIGSTLAIVIKYVKDVNLGNWKLIELGINGVLMILFIPQLIVLFYYSYTSHIVAGIFAILIEIALGLAIFVILYKPVEDDAETYSSQYLYIKCEIRNLTFLIIIYNYLLKIKTGVIDMLETKKQHKSLPNLISHLDSDLSNTIHKIDSSANQINVDAKCIPKQDSLFHNPFSFIKCKFSKIKSSKLENSTRGWLLQSINQSQTNPEDVDFFDNTNQDSFNRDTWHKNIDYLLSTIGFAVDLANIWRFPYLCYKNGGGAFLIPYFLILIFVTFPIFVMETAIGQYTSRGIVGIWFTVPMFKAITYMYDNVFYDINLILFGSNR
ncbi:hypothetical protein A3Q56_07196 [Intoshia linei]|uniref:Transporter n=1 Tax=Intoshia linei TaxID=1819745 RepID=A0A177ASY1_9BILA|nr:hypothetical protein A3Q56_07196 [Intoshia linei]